MLLGWPTLLTLILYLHCSLLIQVMILYHLGLLNRLVLRYPLDIESLAHIVGSNELLGLMGVVHLLHSLQRRNLLSHVKRLLLLRYQWNLSLIIHDSLRFFESIN